MQKHSKHLMSPFWLILICLLFPARVSADDGARKVSTTGSELYQPLIIVGEGWNQKFIFQNIEDVHSEFSEPSRIRLHFFSRDGEPWNVPLKHYGPTQELEVDIPIGGVAVIETEVFFHEQHLGWCKVEMTDSAKNGYLLAQTVFRRQETGRPDFMTTTPLVHKSYEYSAIFIDQTGWKYHGVGVLNADECPYSGCPDSADFHVTFTDADTGEVLVDNTKRIGWGRLWWFSLVHDYPQTINRRGLLRIQPVEKYDGMSATFTLQFAPNGAFTALSTSNRTW